MNIKKFKKNKGGREAKNKNKKKGKKQKIKKSKFYIKKFKTLGGVITPASLGLPL